MLASIYRKRLSDFDGIFYLHKLPNKNSYLQQFTNGLVGINLKIVRAAAASGMNYCEIIISLTLNYISQFCLQ